MKLENRIECPFCNNKKFNLLYRKRFDSEEVKKFLTNYYLNNSKICKILGSNFYEIAECIKCKGLFQKNIPDEELSLFIYEELISSQTSFDKKMSFTSLNFNEYLSDAIIIENLIKKKNNEIKILEFGSGWGFWTRFMKSMNFEVETLEISPSRIDYLKQTKVNNYKNLSEIDKQYDVIFSNQVLEHIPFPLETLKDLKIKLKDDGIMFHKFPSSFLFKKKLSKNYLPKKDCAHPLEHINIFNSSCFNEMCKISGLKKINIKSRNFFDKIRLFKNNFIFNQIILKK